MKRNPKIGLLPLYLKLYDDTMSEYRAGFDPFKEKRRKHQGAACEGGDQAR